MPEQIKIKTPHDQCELKLEGCSNRKCEVLGTKKTVLMIDEVKKSMFVEAH